MSKAEREALLARRRASIVEHIRAGRTAEEIADIEGMDRDEARKLRRQIALEEGVTSDAVAPPFRPLGLKGENRQFIIHLGNLLARVPGHPLEVARLTGLTQSEQRAAMQAIVGHNWTVAQIQRLAAALNMSFEDVMRYCLNGSKIGFK
jgi:DNA-binding CsgD family transcriptional regulator